MNDLVFMMGAYAARFPTDRSYCSNHMWAQPCGDAHRFGLTAFAVRLMQDVYFLEWCVEEDVRIVQRQTMGAIESKKAESDLCCPAAGRLVRFNAALMDDPSAINADTYGSGWLFELEVTGPGLMTPEQYIEHLHAVWAFTQQKIKGQLS